MKAVPIIPEPEIYTASRFSGSRLVEILPDEKIDIKMMYPTLGFENAEERCIVREEVYALLKKAGELLPAGYRFRIWDAWRPFLLQKELYKRYSDEIIDYFGLRDKSSDEQSSIIRRYVSEPIPDTAVPPVHTTGGAVDLTIIGPDGSELDMGCSFDEFTDKTATAYFESEYTNNSETTNKELDKDSYIVIRNNRRLLYNIMIEAGFTNLPSEWWHYDYGDRFWGYYTDSPAIYEGIFTIDNSNL